MKTPFKNPIIIHDGDKIPVQGKGDCTLIGGAKIKGVIHIVEFNCNLLSVSLLTNDLQCDITFFPDFCVMQGLQSKDLISAVKCKGGLY